MHNAEMIIFIILSLTAMASLIHPELIDAVPFSDYQLVYSQNPSISNSLIHKSTIPSGTNIGLTKGDLNIISMDSDLPVENRSNLAAELIANLVEYNLKQAANTLLITSLDPRV